jgi:hypothetical protein
MFPKDHVPAFMAKDPVDLGKMPQVIPDYRHTVQGIPPFQLKKTVIQAADIPVTYIIVKSQFSHKLQNPGSILPPTRCHD